MKIRIFFLACSGMSDTPFRLLVRAPRPQEGQMQARLEQDGRQAEPANGPHALAGGIEKHKRQEDEAEQRRRDQSRQPETMIVGGGNEWEEADDVAEPGE